MKKQGIPETAMNTFNFRNCYTIESIDSQSYIEDVLKRLGTEIEYYFCEGGYEDIGFYSVDFYIISSPEYYRQSDIGVITDPLCRTARYKWSKELNDEKAIDLFMRTFAKLHSLIKITHYDENGVGTPII